MQDLLKVDTFKQQRKLICSKISCTQNGCLTSKIALAHCLSPHSSYQSIFSNPGHNAQILELTLYHYGEHHAIEPVNYLKICLL